MQIHIITFTEAGFSLAQRIQKLIQCASITKKNSVSLSDWVKSYFHKGNALVFIGAAGIAVRAIAPFVRDKTTDPAVLVLDEKGSFVIPVLSGHIGGANELAKKIACLTGAVPVITTASDVNNLTAIDEFAAKNNFLINDMKKAREFAAKKLELHYCDDSDSDGKYKEFPKFSVSIYIKNDMLNLIPRCVVLGIGCKKGKSAEELKSFVCEMLEEYKIDRRAVEKIASIDLKKDEKALLSLSKEFACQFETFSCEELNKISQNVSHSDFVSEVTGTDNVCERSVFAAGAEKIIIHKTVKNGMTFAAGIRKIELKFPEDLKKAVSVD
ncbi:cobalt-precorrin 5A hydrolase [Treponema sp.]|uniref:cobalt-precorrin 5A hydrolase n=1 Tax=Treponema sp. TaxID=166 RepID=UPI00388E98C6